MNASKLEHRQFLKSPVEYKIGDYIPDQIMLMEDTQEESLFWLKQTEFGGVLLFTSCSPPDYMAGKRLVLAIRFGGAKPNIHTTIA